MVRIGNDWDEIIGSEFQKPYYLKLREFLKKEYASGRVFPEKENIFNALKTTPYKSVKAVIIGQDPYHEVGQAHGLCFSVQKGCKIPPSLKNMYKELYDDLGIAPASHGELTSWAKQGVLLLNAVLTVREGQANSHKGKGWEEFTDAVIKKLNEHSKPVAFILWGANAKAKAQFITAPQHKVFSAAHPSPLSAYNGFFGCRHFSKVNTFLSENDVVPIDWTIK
ncbi:MAG: uracil-DNA glycosylase [Oscillospiraceae bacterium]|nr:uracil-DNA glycosylase [Oscillospiraceae bacterium]